MKKLLKALIVSIIFSGLFLIIAYFKPFSSLDYRITDSLYSKLRRTNSDIMIICIDEDTLNEYGSFTSWSRDKIADTINYLYSEPGNEPIAVGLDITYQGDLNEEVDKKLAEACSGNKKIITSSPIVFKGTIERGENDEINYNSFNINLIEYPYDLLRKEVTPGYTNAFLSTDSISRCSISSFDYNGTTINSFSYELAKLYADYKKIEIPSINADENGLFRFFYAGKEKEFPHVSLKTVLSGNIPVSEFKNKIVLIGAYATGMQDSYFVTSDAGNSMYGVEIHANIIQSLLDGKTAKNFNNLYYCLIVAVLIFIVAFASIYIENFVLSLIIPALLMVAHIFVGILLSNNGLIITQLFAIIPLALLIIAIIVNRYVKEFRKRKQITKVFSRYMDPKIVSNLAKDDNNIIDLTGETRDVSVLFVDIRGFTSMSENMDPKEIVLILNEYLELVTNCIFKHGGMLDKFIGDAAMAIFNAPVDQKDYIFESVACAYDIAKGSEELSKKLMDKYGKSVSYGVGVHCGKAVIGNIGSKTRLDYTAIGDTVNTSSRIEGKAGKGEVLISKEVQEALCDRIIVEDAGLIELKGKTNLTKVYRLIGINTDKHEQ